ncbi:uncharacterized protein SCHCODRAFT_02582188 [Schizophyllum commune H4-8]|uniref:uncharacterized protein n=1 Tax=Schizophyllum commune (strain H4-8 / FGSC 9210) TaxID=578458 RepID=UPI002160ADFD|nr:uncharacterized protein SCHCODRAFT_02582188 [Schizophyllum commune H4-8]KAI5889905.1 hypothetical protein SCHCODRAFT_02582188 [Schizophyllum commune H4-8]
MDIDWTANTLPGDAGTYVPYDEQEVGALAADLLAHLERDSDDATDELPDLVQDSDDEEDERDEPDEGEDEDEDEDEDNEGEEDNEDEGVAHSADSDSTPSTGRRHRRVFDDTNNPWYPWPDKETCIVDVLRHVPRCAFSTKQNQVIHWAMSVLGIHDVPTERTMKDVDKKLQSICGVQSLRFVSAFSNIYYTNDIAALIAQEMANPRVRRHLHFLPEKTSGSISEAWQAARWLDELDPAFLTQCIRKKDDKTQDFFVFEPALLKNRLAFMPTRWFIEGKSTYAKGWYMSLDPQRRGWIVEEHTPVVVCEDDLDLSLPLFHERHAIYQVPSPQSIIDPRAGNKWRKRAKGHRVVSFPLWLYCDDTSGNTSKKWNKHNSFLFTAAGLPRRLVHQEYNIHFVSTSNIASPLEMAEGIVAQIKQAQEHGVWAWDAEERDYVLVIPSVFALLGDNPMQSELCCHSGLAANHFCRVCWVEGSDMDDDSNVIKAPDGGDTNLPLSREASPAPESTLGSTSGAKTRKTETLEEASARIGCFMSISERIRTKAETLGVLMEQFVHAKRVGGKTAMNNRRTETGIRDSYQARFLEALTDLTTKKSRTKVQKTADYFWRDIISRLKAPEKEILKARLSSFDTSALNIPPLSGETLVSYAGSLVGRDFRAIAQVAPFVLHDLGVHDDILRVWMALSKVVPLVWQPEIEDMTLYLPRLSRSIRYLLDCTCRFDAQWFNKPKFHMLVHLPEHIRRFGPAMLFATEGFESFNAIIRARSIHSNRHAPSRDIARSMAQSNRIRHLVSGGFFRIPRDVNPSGGLASSASHTLLSPWMDSVSPILPKTHWRAIGKQPLDLINSQSFTKKFLGIINEDEGTSIAGAFERLHKDLGKPKCWERTEMFKHAHEVQGPVPTYARAQAVYTPQKIGLPSVNCTRGDWVLIARRDTDTPQLARIREIVYQHGKSHVILVHDYTVGGVHPYYEMPTVHPKPSLRVISGEDIRCPVSVVHNCKDNQCPLSSTHIVRQESEHTQQRARRVVHHNIDDLILNTGQMRSSKVVGKLAAPAPSLDRQSIVVAAATKLLEKKKRKKALPPREPPVVPQSQERIPPTNPISTTRSTQSDSRDSNLVSEQSLPEATTPSVHRCRELLHLQSYLPESLLMDIS